MPRLIVTDWNGTLFRYPSEERLNKAIGYRILADARSDLPNPATLPRFARLVGAKYLTKGALRLYKWGLLPLRHVYAPFNLALRGQPVEYIEGIVDTFARDHAQHLDLRLLSPIARARGARQADTGILSVAYDYGVRRILEEAEMADAFLDRLIVANTLESVDGQVMGMTLDIYGQKPEVMEGIFFRHHGYRPEQAYYVGDSMDDAGIADLLPKGHFLVPPFAIDRARDEPHGETRAFIHAMELKGAEFAATEKEVERFLDQGLAGR